MVSPFAVGIPIACSGAWVRTRLSDSVATDAVHNSDGLVYVKRWLKTKHAIIFRLSNKSVQVRTACGVQCTG